VSSSFIPFSKSTNGLNFSSFFGFEISKSFYKFLSLVDILSLEIEGGVKI